MAADSNLAEQAYQDILEMQQARIDSDINVIVQLDPRKIEGKFPDSQARRYKIVHSTSDRITSPVLDYLGEIDSGDYLNLVDFVNWGIDSYSAKHYALVIWSHGDGWTRNTGFADRGICPDETQISIAAGEFKTAFEMFSEKIDLLLLDACLMQTVEVLTEIYHRTEYVLGSQNLVPYQGFPYGEIFERWSGNQTPAHIARWSMHSFIESHLPGGSQNPDNLERRISASVMSSSGFPEFLDSVKRFIANFPAEEHRENVLQAREKSYGFHIGETEVDIREFFTHLRGSYTTGVDKIANHINGLLASIDNTFIDQRTINLPENTGTASVWFPLDSNSLTGSKELYNKLTFSETTGWYEFLEKVINAE